MIESQSNLEMIHKRTKSGFGEYETPVQDTLANEDNTSMQVDPSKREVNNAKSFVSYNEKQQNDNLPNDEYKTQIDIDNDNNEDDSDELFVSYNENQTTREIKVKQTNEKQQTNDINKSSLSSEGVEGLKLLDDINYDKKKLDKIYFDPKTKMSENFKKVEQILQDFNSRI